MSFPPYTLATDGALYQGHVLDVLPQLAAESVHCVVTSPPYWGLRKYDIPDVAFPAGEFIPMAGLPPVAFPAWTGQLGLEPDPLMYTGHMVQVFREVRRVLRKDATAWVNLGDGWEAKNLIGLPWRVALALQADGWWLRSEIIWHKPNPMPSSVKDRPTPAHEQIFLLSRSRRYFFDAVAIQEPAVYCGPPKPGTQAQTAMTGLKVHTGTLGVATFSRNKRSVWTIPTFPFPSAHFATFPPALVTPCIKAGCPSGGVVMDPFGGSGTVAAVARELGRRWISVELGAGYCEMHKDRLPKQVQARLEAGA